MNKSEHDRAVSISEPVTDFAGHLPVLSQPPVLKSIITCPKCGTAQEKSSTCVKCFVIFEKMANSSRRQPPARDLPVHQHTRLANIMVRGWRSIARHALTGLILVVIALQPLIACFIVERWSGKEIAWLTLSESKAVIPGRSGIESWNWNNLSDSEGTVFLSPEMNPIRLQLQFSHLRLPPRITDRHFTYSLRLMDENGVAAFEKSAIRYLTTYKNTFANMLSDGDKSTEFLGTLNVNRSGNYKISYDKRDFDDKDISGFMTTTALIMRRNAVVVPNLIYIISIGLGVLLSMMRLVVKRRWPRTFRNAHEVFPSLEKGFVRT